MVFPGYHTETTETENLDRCFNDQTSHRRGARFGAGVGSEAILFNLRYLCYLLFQSTAVLTLNG